MKILVTIITVAFFAQWTCSLMSMQWRSCMGGNSGECRSFHRFKSMVHSLLSAEERVSHYF